MRCPPPQTPLLTQFRKAPGSTQLTWFSAPTFPKLRLLGHLIQRFKLWTRFHNDSWLLKAEGGGCTGEVPQPLSYDCWTLTHDPFPRSDLFLSVEDPISSCCPLQQSAGVRRHPTISWTCFRLMQWISYCEKCAGTVAATNDTLGFMMEWIHHVR